MTENEGMSPRDAAPRSGRPTRLHSAVFQPIGDEGRTALVERRIAEAIMGGVLAAGERLPPETELAAAFGVAPATAREALMALRGRGLIVTRRGRSGGSFIADSADPIQFASRALLDSSRVGLRDAAQHYLAITGACVDLAARRADVSEVVMIRARLERVDAALEADNHVSDRNSHERDVAAWRRASDDAMIEIAALSQSARLTREQMKLQGEFSPLFALVDTHAPSRAASRARLIELLSAVSAAEGEAATRALSDNVRLAVDWLITYRDEHLAASPIPTTVVSAQPAAPRSERIPT
jgi:GntR family transcriptional repressor for pyruvate dehydrogenase complex